jgi:hypothetical protein
MIVASAADAASLSARYDRSKLRYPSDLTDDEWGLAALAGAAALGVWNGLVKLYRFLQWTERLWDTYPQWTPFRRKVRPWGPPRA